MPNPSSLQCIPPLVTKKNDPSVGFIKKRLRQLQSAIELEDPYIVAVLIALAQKRSYQRHQAGQNIHQGYYNRAVELEPDEMQGPFQVCLPILRENFKTLTTPQVHLLALAASQTFCVYKAHFPRSFLEKFDNPSQFSPSGPISISYYPLPHLDPKRLRDELCRNLHN